MPEGLAGLVARRHEFGGERGFHRVVLNIRGPLFRNQREVRVHRLSLSFWLLRQLVASTLYEQNPRKASNAAPW